MLGLLFTYFTFLLALSATAEPVGDQDLPVVDLGYEIHQALLYNDSYDFFKFSNIRYAQPPVGDLRFRAPIPPLVNRSSIQTGNETKTCPQGIPAWQFKGTVVGTKYKLGAPFTLQNWEADIANATVPNATINAVSSEDCLFLDVYVSPKVLGRASQDRDSIHNGAAVLVWIHGGGYVLGSKTGTPNPSQNPAGLVKYGNMESDSGMIYVAINYRLGVFGFLAGDEVKQDGDLNAGLLDQRLGLQWVQDNIHVFGGDASRVTIMGESVGGGSILSQLMASTKDAEALFAQAIAQSPGTPPSFSESDSAYNGFLAQLNSTSLSDVRGLPSAQLIAANAEIIFNSPPSSYLYNSVFDDMFVPAPPGQVFDSGNISKSIKLLVGLNAFEPSFFFDPTVKSEPQFLKWATIYAPGTPQERLDYLASTLYPPIFDGSYGYVDYATRQGVLWADGVFHCNAELLNNYFDITYAYQFSVIPGFHTQDLSYTFTDDTLTKPLPDLDARYTLQRAIASFVVHGVPSLYVNDSASPSMTFPQWDPVRRWAINITSTGTDLGKRTLGGNNTRCSWWQGALFGV